MGVGEGDGVIGRDYWEQFALAFGVCGGEKLLELFEGEINGRGRTLIVVPTLSEETQSEKEISHKIEILRTYSH